MSDNDDDIPTLDEMIFPGRPERVQRRRPAPSGDDSQTQIPRPPLRGRGGTRGGGDKGRPSNFEILITRQVDRILERHMKAAREEIVRVLMIELRSRLPQAYKRQPKPQDDGD